ncbi:MAG: ABC transporter ATP-binding protein [Firmicutes bacterium]|nr:ABC transporter ATP-binding protein [Bacillota bacterium]
MVAHARETERAPEAWVRLVGVSKRFGTVQALSGLTLSVQSGEILVLLGPSGCGKTTALRIVAGIEHPDEGWVELAGQVVAGPRWVPPEARGVGMVFQEPSLFPHLTVLQNVAFGLRGMSRAEQLRRAHEILDRVGAAELAGRFPHELSGGEQQRVALARALAPRPSVVLLDEPLSSLDPELRRRMREEMRRLLKGEGSTAIVVTHDQEEAFALADRIGVLSRGRLWQVGPPEEIYHAPACRFVADFVGEADFLPGRVRDHVARTELGDFPCNGLPEGALVEVMLRPADLAVERAGQSGEGVTVLLENTAGGLGESVEAIAWVISRSRHVHRTTSRRESRPPGASRGGPRLPPGHRRRRIFPGHRTPRPRRILSRRNRLGRGRYRCRRGARSGVRETAGRAGGSGCGSAIPQGSRCDRRGSSPPAAPSRGPCEVPLGRPRPESRRARRVDGAGPNRRRRRPGRTSRCVRCRPRSGRGR